MASRCGSNFGLQIEFEAANACATGHAYDLDERFISQLRVRSYFQNRFSPESDQIETLAKVDQITQVVTVERHLPIGSYFKAMNWTAGQRQSPKPSFVQVERDTVRLRREGR